MWIVRLAVGVVLCSALSGAITQPGRRPPQRQIMLRQGSVPVLRVRSGPVRRIYVPMNVLPQQRYVPSFEPAHWKQKPIMKLYHPVAQHPNRIGIPQQPRMTPKRKGRNPKPKYPRSRKPTYKYPKNGPVFDSYRPQPSYPSLTSTHVVPKSSYQVTASTYGKPLQTSSVEPPRENKASEEAATSYIHVYQGEQAKKDGKPSYGYVQTHEEKKSAATNHRPVYKPKAEAQPQEDKKQGSFQPPKHTYGFTPYEDSTKEATDTNYSANYYKKQPDSVLGPNYFEQNKS